MQALYDSGSLAGLDDAELLGRHLAGGEGAHAAFEAIVARHGGMVYGVCRAVAGSDADADDAFQAVFLVLACRAAGVRRRGALGPWLFGVARRTALQARKQAARRRQREAAAASLTPTAVEPRDPDDAVDAPMEEVGRLPSRYREPVVLCHLQGLSYEAAARRLGCPPGTLSVRLKRTRAAAVAAGTPRRGRPGDRPAPGGGPRGPGRRDVPPGAPRPGVAPRRRPDFGARPDPRSPADHEDDSQDRCVGRLRRPGGRCVGVEPG